MNKISFFTHNMDRISNQLVRFMVKRRMDYGSRFQEQ